jgi:hypothetical protein
VQREQEQMLNAIENGTSEVEPTPPLPPNEQAR